MKRAIHALTPLKKPRTVQPTPLCVFDIETINWTQQYACGFFDGSEYIETTGQFCVLSFIKYFLRQKYRGYVCYAHNGGKFDFTFLLEAFYMDADFASKFFVTPTRAGGRIIEIKIQSKKANGGVHSTWTFRDSMAYFATSLKKLAESMHVQTQKGEFDHNKITWQNWMNLHAEWSPYLESDCRALYESLAVWEQTLISEYSVRLKENMTLAQIAMRVFRINFLEHPILNYQSIEDELRQAYCGGRTEIFTHQGTNLHYYDVNSEYPAVMHDGEFPVGNPVYTTKFSLLQFGLCRATVQAPPTLAYPILPHKTKDSNGFPKLVFPAYEFTGWFCSPELQKAKTAGYRIVLHEGYIFERARLFAGFVDTLYETKRTAENPVLRQTAKLLMNSLYGKFGQHRMNTRIVLFPDDCTGLSPVHNIGDIEMYEKQVKSKSLHILPAIAAFTTCYARLKLYELFESVEARKGSIYYCDTDSIITDATLPTSDVLGGIKDELGGDGIKEGYFLLPKVYAFKQHSGGEFVKCKGFPKKHFSFDNIKSAVVTHDLTQLTYQKSKIASVFESMRRNKCIKSMVEVKRSITQVYNKRQLAPDGIHTVPLTSEL